MIRAFSAASESNDARSVYTVIQTNEKCWDLMKRFELGGSSGIILHLSLGAKKLNLLDFANDFFKKKI